MINVYFADASPLLGGDVFYKYYNKMPEYRRLKIDKVKIDKDKRLSLCAGVLLNRALDDIGRPELVNSVVISKKGRPGFFDSDGMDFNLSHSGDLAMCAISTHSIGCDIQYMKLTDAKVANRHFTDAEKKYVFETCNLEEVSERFYRIWVMKEAYTKLSGEGLTRELNSFDVLSVQNMFWEKVIGDYRMCVAGVLPDESINVTEVKI